MASRKLHGAAAAAHAKKVRKAKAKHARKAAPKATKRHAAKKHARKAAPSPGFLRGYHEGHGDVMSGRPLRRVTGPRDPYVRGYRAGVREARAHKKR